MAQHLRAWIDYSSDKNSLYYWRTKSGAEVDFVLHGSSGLWAVEVKNTKNINKSDLRSLIRFKEDYSEAKTLLVYRGDEKRKINNILCLPVTDFLKNLVPNQAITPDLEDS